MGDTRRLLLPHSRPTPLIVARLEDMERRALAAEAEIVRLQGIIDGMATRIVIQSDLLSKRAERSLVIAGVWEDGRHG